MIQTFCAAAAIVVFLSPPHDLQQILKKVSDWIEEYYSTLINIVARETVRQQELNDRLRAAANLESFPTT